MAKILEPHSSTVIRNLKYDQKIESLEFLRKIWPNSKHHRQIALRNPRTNQFNNMPVAGPEDAIEIAIRESLAGCDVYIALAAFKSNENRTSANAVEAACFWVDIDVGVEKAESGKGYRTIEEANIALIEFCVKTGIPLPTDDVNSGSGLHVYWGLDKAIGRELWQYLAQKLKELARYFNFLADPSRTADISSVLRIPGTKNYKYRPALPVELLSTSNRRIPVNELAEIICETHRRLIGSPKPKTVASIQPCNGKKLALFEAALRLIDSDIEYDSWFRIAVVIFNETGGSRAGFELFDKWSSTGSKYGGRAETLKKWRSLNPNHPSPLRMGTLRRMVEDLWYDWQNDCVAVAAMAEPHEEEVAA